MQNGTHQITAFLDELEKISALSEGKKRGATRAAWSPSAIHKLCDHLGVKWDKDPDFMRLCKGLTGKAHLDQMTSEELKKVALTIARRFKNRVPPSSE